MGQGIISRSNPGNSGDKVGDIRITTRNTLGEKWALCNGESIPSDADYFAKFGDGNPSNSTYWSISDYSGSVLPSDSHIVSYLGNGYFVFARYRYTTDNSPRFVIDLFNSITKTTTLLYTSDCVDFSFDFYCVNNVLYMYSDAGVFNIYIININSLTVTTVPTTFIPNVFFSDMDTDCTKGIMNICEKPVFYYTNTDGYVQYYDISDIDNPTQIAVDKTVWGNAYETGDTSVSTCKVNGIYYIVALQSYYDDIYGPRHRLIVYKANTNLDQAIEFAVEYDNAITDIFELPEDTLYRILALCESNDNELGVLLSYEDSGNSIYCYYMSLGIDAGGNNYFKSNFDFCLSDNPDSLNENGAFYKDDKWYFPTRDYASIVLFTNNDTSGSGSSQLFEGYLFDNYPIACNALSELNYIIFKTAGGDPKFCVFHGDTPTLPTVSVDDESYCFVKIKD